MTILTPASSPQRGSPLPTVAHYYDEHPTAEDLMGESLAQSSLIGYLRAVLQWLYATEGWLVVPNFNLYTDADRMAYPIIPDLALFKGVVIAPEQQAQLKSWRLYAPEQPPPQVVFEISSDATWDKDLRTKPATYAALGVQEYYAYDPNEPPNWPAAQGRLRGWQRTPNGFIEQPPLRDGRLWSPELASWLLPAGVYLRLAERDGTLRLTEAEAATQRADRETQRAVQATQWAEAERLAREHERQRAEHERQRAEAERLAREHERQRADRETQRADRETQRAEAERKAKEAAWAKLRELHIDPATLFGATEPE